MSKATRYITAGGTLFCALGIGFLMQMNAQQNKPEPGLAPEPVESSVITGTSTQGAGLTNDGRFQISDIQLTAADGVTPPKAAPQPQRLPDQPLARTAFDDAAASEAPVGDLPREEPAPEFSCDFELTATPTAAAMVELELKAPCMVNERFTLHHNGLMFTSVTDDAGTSHMTVPALAENAIFIAAFPDGDGAVANAVVSSVEYYDRYVVQWQGQSGLQVHALEYGADYGDTGHVWAGAARDMGTAARGEGGFITRLGPTGMDSARMAEVYTFPTMTAQQDGEIDLSLEAEVTRANCGRDIEAQSLRISGTEAPEASDLVLAMPECDAVGDYLVLKNMFNNLKIAQN
ncbi:hypothetical protein FDP25_09850 [Roseovarius sp. A21]|uniref:Translocase n=1 Tax=Roseovarius bejariae TaxID=2576383 RepID=A0A844CUL6_9RHOB|nr:hypothetical protein [Roseovarius bejariae]MRU15729.1 hypothetical protein [Roseovarius bejariae]